MADITHRHAIERPTFQAAAKGESFAIVHGVTLAVNWARSDAFSLGRARYLGLEVAYTAASSGTVTSQQLEFGILVSNAKEQPDVGADAWYFLPILDAAPTDAVLTGSLPAGADWTLEPEFGKVAIRGQIVQTKAANNNSDKIRLAASFEVTPWRWCHVAYRELGGGGAGSLLMSASLSS